MPEVPMDRIERAVRGLDSYRFRVEHSGSVIYEGELDLAGDRQYAQIGISRAQFPMAEIHWEGEKGFGRVCTTERWLKLRGARFPDYIKSAVEMMRRGTVVSSIESGPHWSVEIKPEELPLLVDPLAFFGSVTEHASHPAVRKLIELIAELARGIEVAVFMKISRENYLVSEVIIRTTAPGVRSESRAFFSLSQGRFPRLPDEILTLAYPEVDVTKEMLLLQLPGIGGWVCKKCHAVWCQQAINLIKKKEEDIPLGERKFTEIYNFGGNVMDEFTEATQGNPDETKHNPLVVGAHHEDAATMDGFYTQWFDQADPLHSSDPHYYHEADYHRDYHHYGGYESGVEDQWYFTFYDPPPPTKPGNRYYSARDWGYGYDRIDEDLNRLTFTQAIKMYNRYTLEGKRCAYLMLGHVVHLLQDVGQPDHARVVPHPGSGMDEVYAYNRYHYCELLAAEAAAAAALACGPFAFACGAAAFALAESVCIATADSDEVGYEKLIEQKWDLSRLGNNWIEQIEILHQPDYDSYFHSMSDFSKATSDQLNLDSALGCGWLELVPPVPGADPDIESDDFEAREPYLVCTDTLVPRIVSLTAGLIQHFYEIVNYPPFVERVAIVQWEPHATPLEFAKLADHKDHCLRYDAHWLKVGGTRTLVFDRQQPLSQDKPAYVFILFGPSTVGPEIGGKRMEEAQLVLVRPNPLGAPIEDTVHLHTAHDGNVGHYYWGTFTPHNCWKDPYTLSLVILGKDQAAHLAGRRNPGNEIDSVPSVIPTVDATDAPDYPWLDYQPGPDKNHKLTISRFYWRVTIDPQPLVVPPLPVIPIPEAPSYEIRLEVVQEHWDCKWEAWWGAANCPVTWELDDQVTRISSRPHVTGPAEIFSFRVDLIDEGRGTAKLIIIPIAPYQPGKFSINVYYVAGEQPYEESGKAVCQIELL